VTDSSKWAIVGAKVTLRDLDRNQTQTTTTDSSGQYTFSDLTIGHYVVHAEQPGFRPLESQPVDLVAQQGKRLDLVMSPGTAVETVNVTDAFPLLETDHATVDQNVDQQQFQQLPINGRNFTSLTVLAPAISTYPQSNVNPNSNYTPGTNDVPGGVLFASGGEVNGQQDNGYYINGVNATANYGAAPTFAPSAEAIQDAKIAVADFSASNGHDISALLVSTKSGTSATTGKPSNLSRTTSSMRAIPTTKRWGCSANRPCAETSLAAISAARFPYRSCSTRYETGHSFSPTTSGSRSGMDFRIQSLIFRASRSGRAISANCWQEIIPYSSIILTQRLMTRTG
jgi:hypothetical protein